MLMSRVTTHGLVDRHTCPLCQRGDSHAFIGFPEIPVLKCQGCGFMFSGRVLSQQDMERHYEEDYGGELHRRGQIVNAGINSMVLGRLLDLRAMHSVLDIGTGYGFLLQALRDRHKLDVAGVELSRQEADHARRALGLNVIRSLPESPGLQKAAFDLVTSFEVIEHICDPVAFLHELADYLKIGGFMVVMTDNFEGRMAKALGAGFPKWIPHGHISHFSPVTLRQAIESTGRLQVVDARSYSPWELLLRNAYYTLRGIRKTPAEVFDLTAALDNEKAGSFRLFWLRKLLNRSWARLTLSRDMQGDLMYFLCRRTS